MASHIRYVLDLNGHWSSGCAALKELEAYSEMRVRSVPEAIAAFQCLLAKRQKVKLWIFRERRLLPMKYSRYKQLCNYLGTSRVKKAARDGLLDNVLARFNQAALAYAPP